MRACASANGGDGTLDTRGHVGPAQAQQLHECWTIPSQARPLFQAAAANFVRHSQAAVDTSNNDRGPLLLISGTADHTVPDVVTRSTLKQYRDSTAVTEFRQFEGRGHLLPAAVSARLRFGGNLCRATRWRRHAS